MSLAPQEDLVLRGAFVLSTDETPQRALRMATLDGARDLGIDPSSDRSPPASEQMSSWCAPPTST